MKHFTLAAAAAVILHTLSCSGLQHAAGPADNMNTDATRQGLTPDASALLKSLLFSDESLEELLAHTDRSSAGSEADPWLGFSQAVSHKKGGKAEEAKKDLRRVLSMPDPETRSLLSAWTALRALGERPRPEEADVVQGVVFELHNEAGIGTVAAYRDGRARFFGGKGAASFWEAPHSDKGVDALIEKFLKQAEPFVKRAPAVERHNSVDVPLDHIRVTVLTFGGLHITDVYGPAIEDERHFAGPILMTSVELLNALTDKGLEKDN